MYSYLQYTDPNRLNILFITVDLLVHLVDRLQDAIHSLVGAAKQSDGRSLLGLFREQQSHSLGGRDVFTNHAFVYIDESSMVGCLMIKMCCNHVV